MTKRNKLISLALLASLAVVATASTTSGASTSTPDQSRLVVTTKSYIVKGPVTYTHSTNLPGTDRVPSDLTNRVARVTLSKYNALGVRMWSIWEQYNYGTRAGWVWTAQRTCDGTGSVAWNYNGCVKLNHWGHLGYIFVGGKIKGDMKSRVSTPWWDLGEHHYPTISMTVYGDGHYTYTRHCGC